MEILKSHRSIRKFKSDEIDERILADVLESGIRAPNTGNMQLYSVIVTKDACAKAKLAPLHFNQAMVTDAPVLLTVCFDFNRFYKWCELNSTATDIKTILWLLNGFIDASLFAQNICIAAEDYGLGVCYLGTTLYNSKEISEILNLPRGVIPVTALVIGYPKEVPERTDRLPLDAIVHIEQYHDYSDDQIKQFYLHKESLEESRMYIEQNGKQNLAQVYAEIRYKAEDNQFFSGKLLEMLKEQGFTFVH